MFWSRIRSQATAWERILDLFLLVLVRCGVLQLVGFEPEHPDLWF